MVHLTLAVSDFLLMLIGSAFWVALGFAGVALAGLAAAGGLFAAVRHHRRDR